MTRSELVLAAAGVLLVVMALTTAAPTPPAPPTAAHQPPPTPASLIALPDQASFSGYDDPNSELPPAPTDLTPEEKDTIKSLFGSDVLKDTDVIPEFQNVIANAQLSTSSLTLPGTDPDLVTKLHGFSVPSQTYPMYFVSFEGRQYPVYDSTLSRRQGYLQWLRQRQRKKLLEQQLRTLLEKQQGMQTKQMEALREQESVLEKQLKVVREQQGLLWQQQNAMNEQMDVMKRQEKEPTPFYQSSPPPASSWQSWTVPKPSAADEQREESAASGRLIITIPGQTTVVANSRGPYSYPFEQSEPTKEPTHSSAPSLGAYNNGVVIPGVPESLAQFSRSQAAGSSSVKI